METSVEVTGPVTLSHNELSPVTGRAGFLNLQLLEGTYSEDWTTPSPLAGRNWSGRFRLVVTDEHGKTLSSYPLNDQFAQTFNDFFSFSLRIIMEMVIPILRSDNMERVTVISTSFLHSEEIT